MPKRFPSEFKGDVVTFARRGDHAYAFGIGSADPLPKFRGGTPSRGTLRHGASGGITSWADAALGITGVYYELVTEEDEFGMPWSWAPHRFEDVISGAVLD